MPLTTDATTMYMTYDARVDRGQVILDNIGANPDVADALAEFGYDAGRIAEGRALLDTAVEAQQAFVRERGEQMDATQALNGAIEAAKHVYDGYLKLARKRLEDDPPALERLRATGPREKTYSGWVGQTQQFYTTALDDDAILEALARYNVTREKLEDGLALVNEVIARNSVQEDEKSEALEASAARQAAFKALGDWMDEFLIVAEVAFRDKPGARKRFGQNAPGVL